MTFTGCCLQLNGYSPARGTSQIYWYKSVKEQAAQFTRFQVLYEHDRCAALSSTVLQVSSACRHSTTSVCAEPTTMPLSTRAMLLMGTSGAAGSWQRWAAPV